MADHKAVGEARQRLRLATDEWDAIGARLRIASERGDGHAAERSFHELVACYRTMKLYVARLNSEYDCNDFQRAIENHRQWLVSTARDVGIQVSL